MNAYILPDQVVIDLRTIDQATQLCDGAGHPLGLFLPATDPSAYEADEPELSDEELDRVKNSSEWYSTAEVLRRLENLR